jgi:hypothetical protein
MPSSEGSDYMGVPPKKKKFVWTDANEDELRDQCKMASSSISFIIDLNDKRNNLDDTAPLIVGANHYLENLNPALLSAL